MRTGEVKVNAETNGLTENSNNRARAVQAAKIEVFFKLMAQCTYRTRNKKPTHNHGTQGPSFSSKNCQEVLDVVVEKERQRFP